MKNTSNQLRLASVQYQKLYWISIALVLISTFSGCATMIGLGLAESKAKKHNNLNKSTNPPGWKVYRLKAGDDLTIKLKDSSTLKGTFQGTALMPLQDYKAPYETFCQSFDMGVRFPQLLDTINIFSSTTLKTPAVERQIAVFSGFSFEHLITVDKNKKSFSIPFTKIDSISSKSGSKLKGEQIRSAVQSKPLALRTLLLIESDKRDQVIPLNNIDSIGIKAENYALAYALIGIGIDAILIMGTIVSISNSTSNDINNRIEWESSCPYVYSYDGRKYILDSETFGGAIFQSAQRTDLDNLEHLKASQGQYQLKLTNELQETQYVDAFKLVVVDHPQGSRLVPAFNGELHALGSLQTPFRAVDQNGRSVLEQVRARDDQFWISNPFFRNPDIPSEGRDAIQLEFKRPAQATSVRLAFQVQNTPWASYMQGQLLGLHGNKLQDWYAYMNSSKAHFENFKQIMIREGMLLIKLWNGHSWKTMDHIWEVGPRIAKDQVVKLNLENIPQGNLRIRLESTVGFWMINSVEADFGEELPVNARALSAFKAIDHTGRDLIQLLNEEDGRYYVMPTTSDWAEISFNTLPEDPNFTRSYLLKSSGYYTIHSDEKGDPQQELLQKLIAEPGAYGQYTLRILNQHLANTFHTTKPK